MALSQDHLKELERIATVIAGWAAELPIRRAFVFGSRVRGDHRPDSDLDVAIELYRCAELGCLPDSGTALTERWTKQNGEDFSGLKLALGIPLSLHADADDAVWPSIRDGARSPVIEVGIVAVVVTPPKR